MRKTGRKRALVAAVAAAVLSAEMPKAFAQGASAAGLAANSPLKKDFERGYRLRTEKRDAEAVAVFNEILKRSPNNHAALVELGYLHENLKHHKLAVKYLASASAQDPENTQLHMDLGYAALNAGYKVTARKSFEAAVAKEPKNAAALKQLGFINLGDGNLPAAASNFEALRAIQPDDYFIVLQLGYTYDRLQQKDKAREAFSAALASTDTSVHDAAKSALDATGGASAPNLGPAPL